MIGTIIGDIAGSRFEFNNHKSKQFNLFDYGCSVTDDTIMALAVAEALKDSAELDADGDINWSRGKVHRTVAEKMVEAGRLYPNPQGSYGGRFGQWLEDGGGTPYNSFGNGSAMRAAACGWAGRTIEETMLLSAWQAEVTHNHPYGIRGAQAIAVAIWIARHVSDDRDGMDKMKEYIRCLFPEYKLNFTLDEIRPTYKFDETCQGTVPVALQCFFESHDFEDAIRNAISVGGDSDTIGAMVGGIAEAFYGVPSDIANSAINQYLDKHLKEQLRKFESFCYANGLK